MKSEIEVALFISNLPDVSGAEESRRKEKVPKGQDSCSFVLGHGSEELRDCHRKMESYPKKASD